MKKPIQQAMATVPFWMQRKSDFDGLEIQPVKEEHDGNGSFCEPCEPEEAHFWSVYGHCKSGGVECFEDFQSPESARKFAAQLLEGYPHLREHGLADWS